MAEKSKLDFNSPAVQKHIEIMQGVIARMAENSRSCKFWCVTLVSAVLVLVVRVDEPKYMLIAFVPAALFLILDTYYLVLEQAFRDSYNAFVDRVHDRNLDEKEVYRVTRSDIGKGLVWTCLRSFSIWPFYIPLILTIGLAWLLMCI